jgi:hypothetical protein
MGNRRNRKRAADLNPTCRSQRQSVIGHGGQRAARLNSAIVSRTSNLTPASHMCVVRYSRW